jgi:hypothetical protein
VLDHYPPYPFYENEISPLQGLRPNHLNHVRTLLGLFPCGELDPDIAPQWERLCHEEWKRTDFWSKLYCCNKGRIAGYTGLAYHVGMTALWLGFRDEAWSYFEDLLKSNVKPSGLIAHNSAHLVNSRLSEKNLAHIPDARIYHDFDPAPLKAVEILSGRLMESATENLDCRDTIFPVLEGPGCYLLMLSESLLQSHNGILRLFPGLPDRMDAQFADLRAQGPTLVSAARAKGRVRFVRLKALAPVIWKLKNPWRGKRVLLKGKGSVRTVSGEIIELKLARGAEVVLAASKSELAAKIRPRMNQPAQARCMIFKDGMLCWLGKPTPSVYYASLEKARG